MSRRDWKIWSLSTAFGPALALAAVLSSCAALTAGLIGAGAGATAVAVLKKDGTTVVHEAPASPWAGPLWIAAIVVVILLLRAWGHWLPPLVDVVKRSVKGAPRALLGGRQKKPTETRFVRRSD